MYGSEQKKLTFCNRNNVVIPWEKHKNSVKTVLMQIIIFRCYSCIRTTPVVVMAFVVRPSIVAYIDVYHVWLNICDSSYGTTQNINVSHHPQVLTRLVLVSALYTSLH